MISSLLLQQVGIGVDGNPPSTLLDNYVKNWLAWLPFRGAMNGLYMCTDNDFLNYY